MADPSEIGKNKTQPNVWESFYRYLMNNWFHGLTAPGVQPSDLKYVGVQDPSYAMATANLIKQRGDILQQIDAGNPGILQSPTVRQPIRP